jgi:hypothetical protein
MGEKQSALAAELDKIMKMKEAAQAAHDDAKLKDTLAKLNESMVELHARYDDREVKSSCPRNEFDKTVRVKEAAEAALDAEKKRMEAEVDVPKGKLDRIQDEKDAAVGTVSEKE